MYKIGVRLESRDGNVRSVVTGDYFPSDEGVGKTIREDACRAMAKSASPLFLIPFSIAKMAYEKSKSAASLKLSSCHEGQEGRPCGRCEECRRARAELFNQIVLYGICLGNGDLGRDLKNAVMSTIGGVSVSLPWEDELDDVNEAEVQTLLYILKHRK